jgi:hypothetical protein
MNAAQQSFNSLLQAYMSQPPQMDQSIDKRRIEVLLQINTVLLYKCVGLQKYVLNQQNITSPNYNEKKELYHNYLKRIHYNLTCLASINDIYSNTPSIKRNYTLPQMVYPPPECIELFEHYKLLNQLYPEAMPFFQKKMALARQQQQIPNSSQSNANPNVNNNLAANTNTNINQGSQQPIQRSNVPLTFQNQTPIQIQGGQQPHRQAQQEPQQLQLQLQLQQQQQQQRQPQPPQQQQQRNSLSAATPGNYWNSYNPRVKSQHASNVGTPNLPGSAKSQTINLATNFNSNNGNMDLNTPNDFNFQQQNNFGVDKFSQGGASDRRSSNQTQGTNMTPQMIPQAILQQNTVLSNSHTTTPVLPQQKSQDFNSMMSPEQILARAASGQSGPTLATQMQTQFRQPQPQPQPQQQQFDNFGQSQISAGQVPGQDQQLFFSEMQFNNPNVNQNSTSNVGDFGSW